MAKRKPRSDKGVKRTPKTEPKETVGLGDVVEAVTEATGIKKVVEALTDDCGCNERKAWLNQWEAPEMLKRLRKSLKAMQPEPLTKEEFDQLTDLLDVKHATYQDREKIATIYNRVYRQKVNCTKCSIARMVKQLRLVYINQKDEFCQE